jgi:DNA-directed RNA polymerase specialized sigma24 family protein
MSARWWLIRGARSGAVDYMRATYGRKGQKAHLEPRNCPWPLTTEEETGEEISVDVRDERNPAGYDIVGFIDIVDRSDLTERQKVVALAIGAGLRQFEIAPLLGVSPSRVNQLLKKMRGRIDVDVA